MDGQGSSSSNPDKEPDPDPKEEESQSPPAEESSSMQVGVQDEESPPLPEEGPSSIEVNAPDLPQNDDESSASSAVTEETYLDTATSADSGFWSTGGGLVGEDQQVAAVVSEVCEGVCQGVDELNLAMQEFQSGEGRSTWYDDEGAGPSNWDRNAPSAGDEGMGELQHLEQSSRFQQVLSRKESSASSPDLSLSPDDLPASSPEPSTSRKRTGDVAFQEDVEHAEQSEHPPRKIGSARLMVRQRVEEMRQTRDVSSSESIDDRVRAVARRRIRHVREEEREETIEEEEEGEEPIDPNEEESEGGDDESVGATDDEESDVETARDGSDSEGFDVASDDSVKLVEYETLKANVGFEDNETVVEGTKDFDQVVEPGAETTVSFDRDEDEVNEVLEKTRQKKERSTSSESSSSSSLEGSDGGEIQQERIQEDEEEVESESSEASDELEQIEVSSDESDELEMELPSDGSDKLEQMELSSTGSDGSDGEEIRRDTDEDEAEEDILSSSSESLDRSEDDKKVQQEAIEIVDDVDAVIEFQNMFRKANDDEDVRQELIETDQEDEDSSSSSSSSDYSDGSEGSEDEELDDVNANISVDDMIRMANGVEVLMTCADGRVEDVDGINNAVNEFAEMDVREDQGSSESSEGYGESTGSTDDEASDDEMAKDNSDFEDYDVGDNGMANLVDCEILKAIEGIEDDETVKEKGEASDETLDAVAEADTTMGVGQDEIDVIVLSDSDEINDIEIVFEQIVTADEDVFRTMKAIVDEVVDAEQDNDDDEESDQRNEVDDEVQILVEDMIRTLDSDVDDVDVIVLSDDDSFDKEDDDDDIEVVFEGIVRKDAQDYDDVEVLSDLSNSVQTQVDDDTWADDVRRKLEDVSQMLELSAHNDDAFFLSDSDANVEEVEVVVEPVLEPVIRDVEDVDVLITDVDTGNLDEVYEINNVVDSDQFDGWDVDEEIVDSKNDDDPMAHCNEVEIDVAVNGSFEDVYDENVAHESVQMDVVEENMVPKIEDQVPHKEDVNTEVALSANQKLEQCDEVEIDLKIVIENKKVEDVEHDIVLDVIENVANESVQIIGVEENIVPKIENDPIPHGGDIDDMNTTVAVSENHKLVQCDETEIDELMQELVGVVTTVTTLEDMMSGSDSMATSGAKNPSSEDQNATRQIEDASEEVVGLVTSIEEVGDALLDSDANDVFTSIMEVEDTSTISVTGTEDFKSHSEDQKSTRQLEDTLEAVLDHVNDVIVHSDGVDVVISEDDADPCVEVVHDADVEMDVMVRKIEDVKMLMTGVDELDKYSNELAGMDRSEDKEVSSEEDAEAADTTEYEASDAAAVKADSELEGVGGEMVNQYVTMELIENVGIEPFVTAEVEDEDDPSVEVVDDADVEIDVMVRKLEAVEVLMTEDVDEVEKMSNEFAEMDMSEELRHLENTEREIHQVTSKIEDDQMYRNDGVVDGDAMSALSKNREVEVEESLGELVDIVTTMEDRLLRYMARTEAMTSQSEEQKSTRQVRDALEAVLDLVTSMEEVGTTTLNSNVNDIVTSMLNSEDTITGSQATSEVSEVRSMRRMSLSEEQKSTRQVEDALEAVLELVTSMKESGTTTLNSNVNDVVTSTMESEETSTISVPSSVGNRPIRPEDHEDENLNKCRCRGSKNIVADNVEEEPRDSTIATLSSYWHSDDDGYGYKSWTEKESEKRMIDLRRQKNDDEDYSTKAQRWEKFRNLVSEELDSDDNKERESESSMAAEDSDTDADADTNSRTKTIDVKNRKSTQVSGKKMSNDDDYEEFEKSMNQKVVRKVDSTPEKRTELIVSSGESSEKPIAVKSMIRRMVRKSNSGVKRDVKNRDDDIVLIEEDGEGRTAKMKKNKRHSSPIASERHRRDREKNVDRLSPDASRRSSDRRRSRASSEREKRRHFSPTADDDIVFIRDDDNRVTPNKSNKRRHSSPITDDVVVIIDDEDDDRETSKKKKKKRHPSPNVSEKRRRSPPDVSRRTAGQRMVRTSSDRSEDLHSESRTRYGPEKPADVIRTVSESTKIERRRMTSVAIPKKDEKTSNACSLRDKIVRVQFVPSNTSPVGDKNLRFVRGAPFPSQQKAWKTIRSDKIHKKTPEKDVNLSRQPVKPTGKKNPETPWLVENCLRPKGVENDPTLFYSIRRMSTEDIARHLLGNELAELMFGDKKLSSTWNWLQKMLRAMRERVENLCSASSSHSLRSRCENKWNNGKLNSHQIAGMVDWVLRKTTHFGVGKFDVRQLFPAKWMCPLVDLRGKVNVPINFRDATCGAYEADRRSALSLTVGLGEKLLNASRRAFELFQEEGIYNAHAFYKRIVTDVIRITTRCLIGNVREIKKKPQIVPEIASIVYDGTIEKDSGEVEEAGCVPEKNGKEKRIRRCGAIERARGGSDPVEMVITPERVASVSPPEEGCDEYLEDDTPPAIPPEQYDAAVASSSAVSTTTRASTPRSATLSPSLAEIMVEPNISPTDSSFMWTYSNLLQTANEKEIWTKIPFFSNKAMVDLLVGKRVSEELFKNNQDVFFTVCTHMVQVRRNISQMPPDDVRNHFAQYLSPGLQDPSSGFAAIVSVTLGYAFAISEVLRPFSAVPNCWFKTPVNMYGKLDTNMLEGQIDNPQLNSEDQSILSPVLGIFKCIENNRELMAEVRRHALLLVQRLMSDIFKMTTHCEVRDNRISEVLFDPSQYVYTPTVLLQDHSYAQTPIYYVYPSEDQKETVKAVPAAPKVIRPASVLSTSNVPSTSKASTSVTPSVPPPSSASIDPPTLIESVKLSSVSGASTPAASASSKRVRRSPKKSGPQPAEPIEKQNKLSTEEKRKMSIKNYQEYANKFNVSYRSVLRDNNTTVWHTMVNMSVDELVVEMFGTIIKYLNVSAKYADILQNIRRAVKEMKMNRMKIDLKCIADDLFGEQREIGKLEVKRLVHEVMTRLFTLKHSLRFEAVVPFIWMKLNIRPYAFLDENIDEHVYSSEVYAESKSMLAMGSAGVFGRISTEVSESFGFYRRDDARRHALMFVKRIATSVIRATLKVATDDRKRYIICYVYDGDVEETKNIDNQQNDDDISINIGGEVERDWFDVEPVPIEESPWLMMKKAEGKPEPLSQNYVRRYEERDFAACSPNALYF